MWKQGNYLLWVHLNDMPVIQWMCGISLQLGRRGICLLANPFIVTMWEFFCPAQSRCSPGAAAGRHKQVRCRALCCLPRILSIWQLARAQAFSAQARIQAVLVSGVFFFFSFKPIYLFWREGKKLNKNVLYTKLLDFLLVEAQCKKVLIRNLPP